MKKIYLIIALVFTVGSGLFFDANAEERNCKLGLTCFLPNDFLEYSTYENEELVWKTTYEHHGVFDENKILVQITDESFDENFGMIVDGKIMSSTTSAKDIDLRSGISAQMLYGYNYNVIQPSPVNIDKWLNHPTSAEHWKDKVTEGNFIFKDKTRSVIIVQDGSIKQIIDKQTGILLLIEYTGPLYDNYFEKLTSTNIIDNNSQNPEKSPVLTQNESIKKHKIPDWIKNTMQWYLDGSISENEMISAIQFLVKEGIIKVN